MAEITAEELQKKLDTLQEKHAELQEEHNRLKVEKSDLLRETMKRKDKIATLEGEIEQARKAIAEKETSVAGEVQGLKVQTVDLQAQIKALSQERDELKKGQQLDESIRKIGAGRMLPSVYRRAIDMSALDPTKPESYDEAVKKAFDQVSEDFKVSGFLSPSGTVPMATIQSGDIPPEPTPEFNYMGAARERQKQR